MKKNVLFIFIAVLAMSIIQSKTIHAQNTLIISEVADPGDSFSGRFVELFNASDAAIDFSTETYYFSRQANGGNYSSIQLTGTIASGETYIIANQSNFENNYGFLPDLHFGDVTGNGDDGYFLFTGGDHLTGTLFDAYGVQDVDGTGEDWEYENSRAKRTVGVANATWTASEWIIESADLKDFDPGTHYITNDSDYPYWITGYPEARNIAADTFALAARINEPGMLYFVVLDAGAGAPTYSDVKSGAGQNGATAVTYGSSPVSVAETLIKVEGLTVNQSYDVHIVIEDDENIPNFNPTITKLNLTTANPPSVLFNADFQTDLSPFTQVSVLGDDETWYQSDYQGNGFASISAYNSSGQDEYSEDWLISSGFDMDISTGEMISFKTANNYGDENTTLQVMLSTDFSGNYTVNDIQAATWDDITANVTLSSGGSWDFVESGEYDISDGTGIGYIAFVYIYPEIAGHDNAGTWRVDDVVVTGFPSPDADATLSDLMVDGETVPGFEAATTSYTVELSAGTTTVPTVTAATNDPEANADVTPATDLTGDEAARTTSIEVTAKNGTTTQTYTILFNPVIEVATLAELRSQTDEDRTYLVTGEVILTHQDGFRNKKYIEDATAAIEIDDSPGIITTTYAIGDGITGIKGKIEDYYGMLQFHPVEDPGAATSTNTVEPQLVTVSDFLTNFESYEAEFVKVEGLGFADAGGTFSNGDNYKAGSEGDTLILRVHFYNTTITGMTIPVMADFQGVVIFDFGDEKIAPRSGDDLFAYSSDASLSDLTVNGTTVTDFDAATLSYNVMLPVGTTDIPTIGYTVSDDNADVNVSNPTDLYGTEEERTASIEVTSQDGSETDTYIIVFTVDNTGVRDMKTTFEIYPVPAGDILNVRGIKAGNRIEIVDITGSVVKSTTAQSNEISINLSELSKGIYLIRAESTIRRFIKK